MRSGQILGIGIVLSAAALGAGLWYAQTRAYYVEIDAAAPAAEIFVTRFDGGEEPLLVTGFEGIDADTSPLRYRACFETPMSLAAMTETYLPYGEAEPLNAPGWFSCFDSGELAAALDEGSALAFLGQRNEPYGFDRVVAVTADGQGYSWPQINFCGEAAFGGDPLPPGCPPVPQRTE
ncbi:histidine kinase [Rhodobacterales bacterium HKCCE3408]|nr:histidine kinase [Rhodobacterales bacterium HKCCE3408]